ncbi:hypothetical protein GQ457_16G021840 [Hibiscus cannabinus]
MARLQDDNQLAPLHRRTPIRIPHELENPIPSHPRTSSQRLICSFEPADAKSEYRMKFKTLFLRTQGRRVYV